MGLLRAIFGAFASGQKSIMEVQRSTELQFNETCDHKLIYPAALPTFEEITAEGHNDRRALVYTVIRINANCVKPFSTEELSAQDFGSSRAAYDFLVKKGLAEKLSPTEEIATLMSKDEMKAALVERGISGKGTKQRLAEKLVDAGYKIDRRKYRTRLFRLTESGKDEIRQYYADRQVAVEKAITALETLDYETAVAAYRDFDNKWGFSHTSGKKHTIFAHYDISLDRFAFFESYPMRELSNTDQFKKTLRACLIAGLMRGCQDSWELRNDFERICGEKINCPRLFNLFDYDRDVLEEMKKQAEFDAGNALEYFLSHVEYLSRHSD